MLGLLERCRLCMKKYSSPSALKNIFLDGAVTVETIKIVTHIEVVEGDGLPPYACQLCIYQLKYMRNFIQSCIDCNEKLKSLCMVQATIATAVLDDCQSSVFAETACEVSLSTGPLHPVESESVPVTEPLPPVATPGAHFLADLKTEPSSPHRTEHDFQIMEQGTNVQNTQDNTGDSLEPKEEKNIVDETDAADISGQANDAPYQMMARENNLQIKAEQIAGNEYFDGDHLLWVAADNTSVPDLNPTNAGDLLATHLETNSERGELDPVLTEMTSLLNKATLASRQQLLPTTTESFVSGQDSCTENVSAEDTSESTEANRMQCSTQLLQAELAREKNLQIKAEQISGDEYFDGDQLLRVAADNTSVPDLEPTNAGDFTTHLETNSIKQGELDPVLTEVNSSLNESSLASRQQLLPTTTELLVSGQDSCTENVSADDTSESTAANRMQCSTRLLQHEMDNETEYMEQDVMAEHLAVTAATNSGHLVGSKPTPLRCQSRPRRLLRSLSRKRKRGLQCRKCLRVFPRLALFRQHVCDSTGTCDPFDYSRMFECKDCSAGFSSHASLEIHQKQHTRNYKRYRKAGLDSEDSDFSINSSDSQNSIFKCPDSEDSNRDCKSSDSEDTNRKSCLDSEHSVLQSVSDSEFCEIDTISLESDGSALSSNSDSDEPEMNTSVESEGSGLKPNSDSEWSCRDSSTSSEGSPTASEDLNSSPDLQTVNSSSNAVDFGRGSVLTSPNAESKKNTENEPLVCTGSTITLQSTTRQRNTAQQSLGLTANLDCLEKNGSGETLHFLRSGRGNSLAKRKRCIQDEDAGNEQHRKMRCCISSKLGSQEKSKKQVEDHIIQIGESDRIKYSEGMGRMPCVLLSKIDRLLPNIGPVCARTRSRVVSNGVSGSDHCVALQLSLSVLNGQHKKSVIRKEKELGYVKQCKVLKENVSTNCKIIGEGNGDHKVRDLLDTAVGKKQKCNNESQTNVVAESLEDNCAKARESSGLTRNMEELLKELQQEKGDSKEDVQEYEVIKNNVPCITKTANVEHVMPTRKIEEKTELKRNGSELSSVQVPLNSKEKCRNGDNAEAEPKTNSHTKKVSGMVKVENVKRNNNMAGRRSMIESGRRSTLGGDPLNSAVSVLEKASTKRRSLCSAAPDMSFRCWKCGKKFSCSGKLIKHFSRHLQAML